MQAVGQMGRKAQGAFAGMGTAVTFGSSTSCGRCHRSLKAPESRKRGLGPVCAAKMGRQEAREEAKEAAREDDAQR